MSKKGPKLDMTSAPGRPYGVWPAGFLGKTDWYVVRLPPVEALEGWREYFGLEPEKAAA